MAITPNADKDAFFERITNDEWVAHNMQLNTNDDKVKHVIKRRYVDGEMKNDNRYILIFDIPATSANIHFQRSGIQVDVLFPSDEQDKADTMLEQIIALCGCGWEVNGRTIQTVTSTGDLAAAYGFYRAGARFYYLSAIPAEPRKAKKYIKQ